LLARQFFQSILNKNSCLNYLLPEERSDRVIDKLRHPSIFKLPHVHTTRSKTSFINYALDHYIWFYLAVIGNLLYFVLCVCLFLFLFIFNPAFGLQLSLINWVECLYTLRTRGLSRCVLLRNAVAHRSLNSVNITVTRLYSYDLYTTFLTCWFDDF